MKVINNLEESNPYYKLAADAASNEGMSGKELWVCIKIISYFCDVIVDKGVIIFCDKE